MINMVKNTVEKLNKILKDVIIVEHDIFYMD